MRPQNILKLAEEESKWRRQAWQVQSSVLTRPSRRNLRRTQPRNER